MKYDTNINNSKPTIKYDTNINKNVKKYDTNISRMINSQNSNNNNKNVKNNSNRKVNSKKHKPINGKPGCLFLIVAVIVVGVLWGGGLFFDYLNEQEELKVESYNDEELLLMEIKGTDYDASIKDIIEEYINGKYFDGDLNTSELEETLGTEDFNWLKEQYNNALDKLYFSVDKNKYGEYDLIRVIEDAENGMNDSESSAIESFFKIKRELLTSGLDKKLFTNGTIQVMHLVEQTNLAQELEREKEREKERVEVSEEVSEEVIYDYMKNEYNLITNFGASYVPEIHDNQVAELASEKFGISSYEAGNIYVKMEMRGF